MVSISSTTIYLLAGASGICVFCCILGLASRFGLASGQTEGLESKESNRRAVSRFGVKYGADIQVFDRDQSWVAKADLMNVSDYGALIRAKAEIPLGTPVRLRIPEIKSAVTGHVRSCTKKWLGYEIGLEFRGTLYKTSF